MESNQSNQEHIFACGCGFTASSLKHFKEHSLIDHNGKFIQNSSHYLTSITMIVMPVTYLFNQNQDQVKIGKITKLNCENRISKKQSDEAGTKHIKIMGNMPNLLKETIIKSLSLWESSESEQEETEEKCIKMYFTQKNQQVNNSKKIIKPSIETFKNQIKLNQKQQQKEIVNYVQDNRKMIKATFQQNNFLLVPNKFRRFKHLICGKCKMRINPESIILSEEKIYKKFIRHCIEVCGDVHHPQSSYFIFRQEQLDKIEQINSKPQKFTFWNSNNFRITQQLQRYLRLPNIDIVGSYTRADHKIDGFKKAIIQRMQNIIKSNIPIISCNLCFKQIKQIKFYVHSKKHLSNASSKSMQDLGYVIVRGYNNAKYILNVHESADNQIWNCPCRPFEEMNRNEYVKHLIKLHGGISLVTTPH